MRYFLFILANALLFIRPSEFVAEIHAVEFYRYVILACLAVSLPVALPQLVMRYPGVPPIAGCVLALFPAVVLSNLFHGNLDQLQETSNEFFKVLVYFILFLALINSAGTLRRFLWWLTLFSALLALIAVVRFHTDMALPTPPPPPAAVAGAKSKSHGTFVIDRVRDPETGQLVPVHRMCGTGIFNDPNDLALALVCGIPLCLYWLTDPNRKSTRPLWIGLTLLFGYALMQTHSRGGFLALMAGMGSLFYSRYGGKKSLLIAAVCLPLLAVVFAGRMTSISAGDGTGQSRIQLWSDGLLFFQQSPLFGIGMENYREYSSHVAHNSYIHCFAELGFFGGTLFLGAFYLALRGLFLQRTAVPSAPDDPDTLELRRLQPYLMAMLASYVVGIAFLSRSYVVPTYMILAVATVYLRLHASQAAVVWTAWNRFAVPRLAGVGFSFLIASYAFVRVFVNWR